MRQIILASTSPRRKQLLEQIGVEFTVEQPYFDEDVLLALPPNELVQAYARGKATDVAIRFPEAIVIGGDSMVLFDGKLMGKPKSEQEARDVLRMLSGKSNEILTGLAVMCKATGQEFVLMSSAKVYMAEISDEEIDEYIASGEPMDKAGSYAVQDRGARFIERIDGDYGAAVGLPVSQVWRLLKQMR